MNKRRVAFYALFGLLALSLMTGCDQVQTSGIQEKPATEAGAEEKTKEEPSDSQTSASEQENVDEAEDTGATAAESGEVKFSTPKAMDGAEVLKPYLKEMTALAPDYYKSFGYDDPETYIQESLHFYDVGEIMAAPYEGKRLVLMLIDCEGPCFTSTISRFARDVESGELIYLDAQSNEDYLPDHVAPLYQNADEEFTIKALELPKTIMLPDGSNSVSLLSRDADMHATENDDSYKYVSLGEEAFRDPKWGPLYFSDYTGGCLYLKAADGSIATYGFDPKLLESGAGSSITWKDGSDTTWLAGEYALKSGGCGIGNACYMVEKIDPSLLVEAGKTGNGDKIYLARDMERVQKSESDAGAENENFPQQDLNATYDTYLSMFEYLPENERPANPVSYEEYLDSKPIIYWQDPFGRFSGLIRTDFRPPAECGKPVIYLYPETTTEVSVKVGIDEFTVTEPAYNDGWKVLADSAGNILNLADGKTYPYLFWEGKSSKTLQLSGGFVVAKADLDQFLTDSLDQLGLNEKESADFREFWVGRMQEVREPYLLVSFVGTSAFNKIAPLEISPAPDTMIRVFMYYQPIWQPIEVPAQQLSAPARTGFTVVEWGGTSSDGWQTR